MCNMLNRYVRYVGHITHNCQLKDTKDKEGTLIEALLF